jgi:hypothetical protein
LSRPLLSTLLQEQGSKIQSALRGCATEDDTDSRAIQSTGPVGRRQSGWSGTKDEGDGASSSVWDTSLRQLWDGLMGAPADTDDAHAPVRLCALDVAMVSTTLPLKSVYKRVRSFAEFEALVRSGQL